MSNEVRVATNSQYKPVTITLEPGDDETPIDLRIGDTHPAEHVLLTRTQAATIAGALDAMARTADSD